MSFLMCNFTLRQKISLFLGVLVIFNFTLAFFVSVQQDQMRVAIQEYAEHGVTGQVTVLTIEKDINYVSRLTRSIMLGDDYIKNLDKLRIRIQDIREGFRKLDQGYGHEPELSAIIKNAHTDTDAFLTFSLKTMENLEGHQADLNFLRQAWIKYSTEGSPRANKARDSFGKLLDRMDGVIKGNEQAMMNMLSFAEKALTIAISISSILTIVIGILLFRSVVAPLSGVVSAMRNIAQGDGDLTRRMEFSNKDEIGQIADAFNQFVSRIQEIIHQVADASSELSDNALRLKEIASSTHRSVEQQHHQTSVMTDTIHNMTTSIDSVADSARQTSTETRRAAEEVSRGHTQVEHTTEVIGSLAKSIDSASSVVNRLEEDSEKIGSVLDVIRGIAEQTNLLALNAAIEAARAGEQGRGFAVVADEVRNLASRTQQSTAEIQKMIQSLQGAAREAVRVMAAGTKQAHSTVEQAAEADAALTMINTTVDSINRMSKEIVDRVQDQQSMADEVLHKVQNITDITRLSTEGAKEASQRGSHMLDLANKLQSVVRQFKA